MKTSVATTVVAATDNNVLRHEVRYITETPEFVHSVICDEVVTDAESGRPDAEGLTRLELLTSAIRGEDYLAPQVALAYNLAEAAYRALLQGAEAETICLAKAVSAILRVKKYILKDTGKHLLAKYDLNDVESKRSLVQDFMNLAEEDEGNRLLLYGYGARILKRS